MKIETKQYRHAPELLEIRLNGKLLNKNLYKNKGYEFYKATNKIRFVRENILNKHDTNKRFVYIEYKYKDAKYSYLNNSYAGLFKDYNEIKKILELIRNRTLDSEYKINITFNKAKAKSLKNSLNK